MIYKYQKIWIDIDIDILFYCNKISLKIDLQI